MERKRILIAANHPEDVQELRKKLVTCGYEVKIVNNGFLALKLCADFRPHLLAAELNLPKIDGHHLLRELRSRSDTKLLPFVLMSPHRPVGERVHSINLGVDDYITIPFESDEVALRFEILLKELEKYEAKARRNAKGFCGNLRDIKLIELLHTLHVGGKSCVVTIHHDDMEGQIFIKQGQLCDASQAELPPREAFLRMCTWDHGTFRVELRQVEQNVEFDESTETLLNSGLNHKHAWEKAIQDLPELTTHVCPGENIQIDALTDKEMALINSIQKSSRLIDLIQWYDGDDLEAVAVLAKLLRRGVLQESPDIAGSQNGRMGALAGHAPAKDNFNYQIARLIVNFLAPESKLSGLGAEKKRRERRRLSDRRSSPRRWTDVIHQRNRVYLNKSELLMIREKLANGNKS